MEREQGKRLKKYSREQAENLPKREITQRSIQIIDIIHRYKFIPTSLIVRLIDGDMRTTERHLQNLYHQGVINRFAFPSTYYPSEFNYFLDDKRALNLLINDGQAADNLDYETVKNNRSKKYGEITLNKETIKMPGRLMHLHHEIMISRFHFMLEKACAKTKGMVRLLGFYQGSVLWNKVETAKVVYDREGNWHESDETETLPHRPDAFFALHFPDREAEDKTDYYFYEADRKHTSIKKFNKKLRAHFHYVVKQKKHRQDYNVKRIKAVLIESTEDAWTNYLRIHARHPIVSGNKPSPLFWFTTSKVFEQKTETIIKAMKKEISLYLEKPELIFRKIWVTPLDGDEPQKGDFKSLLE
jgi:hypothetical protein